MKKLLAVLAVAGTMYVNVSSAQTIDNSQMDTVANNFIMKASAGGMKEVQTGKLAETKGQSASVRDYAAQMVADHTKANAELMKIAKDGHYNLVPPPASLTAPDPMLTQASGADFDKIYVKMMIMDHQKTIAWFEDASTNAVDPNIKAFAAKTLPTLKMHLAKIKSIAAQMGLTAN